MNLYKAYLPSISIKEINSFFDSFRCRTHNNNNFFRIFCTIIVKEFIIPSCNLINFIHIMLNSFRYNCCFNICTLFTLKINIRIYIITTICRMFRI